MTVAIWDFTSGASSPANKAAAVAASPNAAYITGMSWDFKWSDIQPNSSAGFEGWPLVETALNAAQAHGMTSVLRVEPGKWSPAWATTKCPSVTFLPGGVTYTGPTITMPIPWTSVFIGYWTAFISALGARYGGVSPDPRISMVEVAGCGWEGESTLGIWQNNGWTDVTQPGWNGHGALGPYTNAKIETAWTTVLDAFVAAFPSTLLCYTADEPLSNDAGNTNGTSIVSTLWGNSVTAGITRFQANALGAHASRPGQAQYLAAVAEKAAGNTIGWQEWLASAQALTLDPGTATTAAQWFQNAVNIDIATGAAHTELYHADVLLLANRAAIAQLSASGAGVVAPSAPTNVVAVPGTTTAAVSWTPSYNGGSAVTSTKIKTYLASVYQPALDQTVTGTGTSGTVTGLSSGTAYQSSAASTNSAGTGPESALSAPYTPVSPATVPLTPAAPTGAPQNGEIDWAWVAPGNGGAAIDEYRLTETVVGGSSLTPVIINDGPPPSAAYRDTALSNGVAYTSVVEAHNSVGWSSPSPASAPYMPASPKVVATVTTSYPPTAHPAISERYAALLRGTGS